MKIWYNQKCLFFCTLLLMVQAHSSNIKLYVEGLSSDLQYNVNARLSTINKDNIINYTLFKNKVDNVIREGLRALGYYSATIRYILKSTINNNSNVLLVHISIGKPVKIAGINIILHGNAQKDSDYKQWIINEKPPLGTILNHGTYDKFKNGLFSLALRKGYFDAKFRKNQLIVSPSHYKAYWDIDFDSGKSYYFGKIHFYGTQIRKDYLQNLVKIHEGEQYSGELIAELNRKLSATNWFNTIALSPDFSNSKHSKILPLNALVTPRTSNSIETGIGYASDEGIRIKANWCKPWLNSRGHSLQTKLSISTLEQSADLSYKIPINKNPLEQYYLLQGGFKREHFKDIYTNSKKLNIARYWDLSNSWQRTFNLRWSIDRFKQTNITDTTMLIYNRISINRTRQRGGIMPTWGDSQRYSMDVSNTIWGSDINFIILQAQNVWIRQLTEKHRFIARGHLGWIETNSFKRIPPSMRFYAGGDRSIRGYPYKSIATRNKIGKLIGATKLATGSLEFQYKVTSKWWGVMFIDSGEAVNNIRINNFKTGTGIGIRWQSPVGLIKLDISTPVANKYEHGVQFYVGLGPEL